MQDNTTNDKYLKVIESIGELLLEKDKKIRISEYEIKALKKKIERIEQYISYYEQSTDDLTEEDYKNASDDILKQSI